MIFVNVLIKIFYERDECSNFNIEMIIEDLKEIKIVKYNILIDKLVIVSVFI